ncbi:acetylornithine transaminase [Nocardioides pocheonensis]|uniref:Acetylornithine aminotransferase n=1 Tax=Nocardioides pocheonensis TaxID=661485 RepID=A0A3N0GG06_9ACTN|nr:acetylornithine transaminase [Nocardioides pocheonensis]RNM11068.1 acetylornithine transaminase [Nocardioides pocheonensis]
MSEPVNEPSSIKDRYSAALMNTFGPPRLALVRGEGAHVWDEDGREYVDLFGGIAVNALGHAHPALVDAVAGQLRTLGHVSNFFTSGPQVELAERLLALLGASGRVFFTNSGTEANEAAFKMTRRTGRTRLVAMEGAFHGRTMGALALTAKAAYREPFEPLPGEVTFVPYGDAAALAAAVDDTTAAVVVEPIQGEAGVVVPPEGFLAAAREITSAHGALLWVDEVQTGVGRTGDWFAHARDGVVPDIVTLAKGLGGGVPIGAAIAVGAASTLLQPGNHGTTFGGNPVACAAALAVLDTIEKESLLAAAVERGDQLTRILLAEQEVTDVEGRGLLLGAQLADERAAQVVARAQERGFLLNNTGPARLRFAPPLTVPADDLAAFGAVWAEILEADA